MATELVRTGDLITGLELRQLLDVAADDPLGDCIPVCAGEWRKDEGGWRFYSDPGFEQ